MGPVLASSVYYVSAYLRQALCSLLFIVCDRDVALSRVARLHCPMSCFWDDALVAQGKRRGSRV